VKSADQKGHCDAHAELRSGWTKREDRSGSTTSRNYGHAWRIKRARILKRDHYLCQSCAKIGRVTSASEVDHVVSRANGGTEDDDNLQSLCNPCHKAKTATEKGQTSPAGR
jgi:5-methylcytosine-specific restriction protein A